MTLNRRSLFQLLGAAFAGSRVAPAVASLVKSPAVYANPIQGATRVYKHMSYGLRFQVSKELLDEDNREWGPANDILRHWREHHEAMMTEGLYLGAFGKRNS